MLRSCALSSHGFLVALASTLVACSHESAPTFVPQAIVDSDVYSQLARRSRATHRGGGPAERQAALELLDQIASTADATTKRDLEQLRTAITRGDTPHTTALRITRLVASAHRKKRGVIYLMYGDITEEEVERERPGFATLELALNLRGYRLHRDECATGEDWASHWARRDAAGAIWRSEGWFSRKPQRDLEPSTVMSRVWSRDCGSRGKSMIFADSWASVVPEGLGLLVMASCGTGGPFADDEVNLLDQLGDASQLRYRTFDTELGDRVTYLKSYRGLLASTTYVLDDLSTRAALRMLPDRGDLEPDLVESARSRLVAGLGDAGQAVTLRPVLENQPLAIFVPRLLAAMKGAPSAETSARYSEALSVLVRSVDPQQPIQQTHALWSSWWEARGPALETIEATAPAEDRVWTELYGAFSDQKKSPPGSAPEPGISHHEHCWDQWMRCQLGRLPRWQQEGGTSSLLRQTQASEEHHCAPLPQALVVRYDPATAALQHNLAEVLSQVSPQDIAEHCSNR